MLRETVGLAYAVERNLRLKTSVEYYQFTDRDSTGRMDDVAIHAGVAGTF
jgi:opacity protein-like surface antigen